MKCARCCQVIENEENGCNALGENFHNSCFHCNRCGSQLFGKRFVHSSEYKNCFCRHENHFCNENLQIIASTASPAIAPPKSVKCYQIVLNVTKKLMIQCVWQWGDAFTLTASAVQPVEQL